MESESGYYHFLVGILNSEYENYRSFAPLYGYTEILPSRITTDKVVSGNGNSYFDMLANAMKLGTALDFNSQGDGKLRIKGTLVQSQGGDAENVIGCYRGAFDYDTTYYNGDEVTYTSNGCTSTYRYIYPTPVSGVFPVNTTYWEVTAKGAQGPSGISPNTAFKSIVFKRSNTAVSRPTGGSYSSPVPSGWSDGVPSGEAKLWMSTRIFSSDGLSPQESQWTAPRQMTDTADIDIEYSSVENPSAPSGHPNTNTEWSDTADETTIWMATSKKSNGVWGNWEVSRIKGERGSDGTSVSVKGTSYNHFSTVADWTEEVTTAEPLVLIDSAEVDGETVYNVIKKYGRPHAGSAPGWMTRYADVGDGYVMESDGHLWMADTDGWKDIGQFRGQTGATGAAGQNAYLHIKYAKSTTTNDWSDNNGETPDAYIGTYADNNPTDQLVWSLYTWKKWQGEDGFGYEYIFKKTQTETAPSTPTSTSQSDNYVPSGWTDDPSGTSEEYPYEWICYRKKTYGVWGAFIGSDADHTKAALHSKYGKDGNFYEYRYKVTGSPSETPSLTNNVREPSGWATSYTAPAALQYLWRTVALINGKTNALIGTWSTPVRETPVDAVNVGENLVDNSEEQETFDIVESGPYNDSTPPSQFGTTTKRLYRIPRNGTKISCQVRVTLQGCSFKSGGGSVLVYMNGTAAWPAVGQKTGITANGTYDLKNENFTLDYNGGTMYNAINVRFNNFNAGGTVTIELVKVEEGASCTAWCLSEADKSGPAPIFRSTYDSSKTYIGTRHRVDVVKYNGSHYVTRTDIGSVTGVVPTNKQYWNDFGGQFESIATGLLLAELANIAGFIFKNNKLISQKGTKNGAESTDYSAANFIPNLILDGVNGDGVFRGIVHASLMYSNVKVVTTSMTPYHIDPAQEPFNWFFINQNMSQIWLYLPHSSDYDGLEINILQKHTNWLSDSRDVRLRVDSGDTLYAKYFSDEVYANYHTFQGPNSVQLCLNTHYVVKAINGAWYIIFGAVSGW